MLARKEINMHEKAISVVELLIIVALLSIVGILIFRNVFLHVGFTHHDVEYCIQECRDRGLIFNQVVTQPEFYNPSCICGQAKYKEVPDVEK